MLIYGFKHIFWKKKEEFTSWEARRLFVFTPFEGAKWRSQMYDLYYTYNNKQFNCKLVPSYLWNQMKDPLNNDIKEE